MIHWKNKRLDKLSNSELQQALTESVGAHFGNNTYSNHSDITSTFVFGILTGAVIAALAILASTM